MLSGKLPGNISKTGDIKVLCRVRPALPSETLEQVVQVVGPNSLSIPDGGEFAFDSVLGPEVTQEQVFANSGEQVVECVLDGFHSTVLVYGQTNAGKTFTMTGTLDNPGIIERFAKLLFTKLHARPGLVEFTAQASYVEIYLEQVRDLLRTGGACLQIRENQELGIHIPDAATVKVYTWQELVEVCRTGQNNRATSETLMNQVSSRSHSVLLLTVRQMVEGGTAKTSKVSLVDLAGSEQVKRTGAEGNRLAEAQAINSSLSALGNVIHALTAPPPAAVSASGTGAGFIPYRDSKLTRLLQESLGGNAKTWLIVNVSPSRINLQETISTLRFGQRAKAVKNCAHVNAVKSSKELELELSRAYERIAAQQQIIKSLRGGKAEEKGEGEEESVIVLNHQVDQLRAQLEQTTRERDVAQEGLAHGRTQATVDQ
ncbi:hypothetical protein BASA81_005835 [Batrachochytrium salamandrivorans]|nr:hypothetical protein BASA81_005835 [Batrachochytrium salamandrivorans]